MNEYEIVEPTCVRIQKALSLRGMKQADLVEKTGIPKGSISQYVKGFVEPKQDRLYLLGKALSVSPVWLMGLDVPMEEQRVERTEENATVLANMMKDARHFEYIKKTLDLDAKKKEALYSYIDFLVSNRP